MIENRSAWAAKPIEDNDLPVGFQDWLAAIEARATERGFVARPQFIKRRARDDDPLTLIVGTQDGYAIRECEDYSELYTIDPFSLDFARDGQPLYFVCTNGSRDACCSRLGLPVWQTLESAYPGQVWQTTHTGGHRFAANILALPEGLMFGRVRAENVLPLIEDLARTEINYAHVRGRTFLSKEAQACEPHIEGKYQNLVEVTDEHAIFHTDRGREIVSIPTMAPLSFVASCGAERTTELVFV